MKRRTLFAALGALATPFMARLALAQGPAGAYPSRPIRMIYPGAPGGVADGLARLTADKMTESLGQPFVMDYRAGANGIIGADALAKAAPDGYTIGFCNTAMIASATLQPRLPYDVLKDFVQVSQFFETPYFLVVNAALPVNSVRELVDLARSKPRQLGFATPGVGSTPHIAAEAFARRADIQLLHVPYKAVAPSITAVVAGESQIVFSGLPAVRTFVDSKRLKVLAALQPRRSPFLPDVPSIDEAGMPGLNASSWQGFCAPAGTPSAVLDRLAAALQKALASPDLRQRFATEGAVPVPNTPQAFRAMFEQSVRDTAAVIKAAGIKSE